MALERIGGYRVDQEARDNLGLIVQFGGTVGGFRSSLLKNLHGWDERILAEYVDPNFIAREYRKQPFRFVINKWASTYCDTAIKNEKVVNSADKRLNYMYSCVIIGLGTFGLSFLLLAISLTNL